MRTKNSKKKKLPEYYMENIQIALKKETLLKEKDFEVLLDLDSWKDWQQFLSRFSYQLGNDRSVMEIEKMHSTGMKNMRQMLQEMSIDEKDYGTLFYLRDQILQVPEEGLRDFDRNLLTRYASAIEENQYALVREYAKCKIDFFLMKQFLYKRESLAEFALYAKGHISADEVLRWANLPVSEDSFAVLEKSYYHQMFRSVTGSFDLEKACDDYVTTLFRQYRHQVRGAEGIFAYVRAKNMELYNVRLILKGKLYGISKSQIKERMRVLNVSD